MTTPAYRIDGRPVAPEHFYATACDPRRSVVVEACAGAGKTWMLVSRILRALLDGVAPGQILAITFTRKAAGEMRERLDEWLAEFAAPACDEAKRIAALQQRGLAPEAARALAPALGALHERVLREGRGVAIQTFHGWFAQLLGGAPMGLLARLGLAPGLQLLEDTSPHRAELLRDFHRAVQADAALRSAYVGLVRRHRRHTVQQWLDTAWQRGPELEAAAAAGTLDDAVPPAPEDPAAAMQAPAWRAELQALATALGQRDKPKSTTAAEGLAAALAAPDARAAFELAWQALMTQKGEPRKQLGDLPAQAAACQRLQQIARLWLQQDAHEDHARMAALAQVLLRCWAALKRRRALADMGDLERLASVLLNDPEVSGWVQERLDVRVRHLLVDEFQDTSPLQWQTLHGWLAGYAGAGGGASGQAPLSVFLVGDPKQSIYRFRRAEPRVFAAARDFVAQALDGAVLACDHTRRNAPELLEALNSVFERAGRDDGWDGFRPHTSGADPGGGLWMLPDMEEGADETGGDLHQGWRDSLTQPRDEPDQHRARIEAAAIAAAIAGQVSAGAWKPGDVMVLARRRAMLARVAEAMAALGLPCTVPEALALADAPEAQDLIALLDVLASPGHDLSLARVLKSPLFGADDADLLWLSQAARGGWWALLVGDAPPPGSALPRACRLLRAWAEATPRLPPHDLLDRIVHEGELLPRLAAALPPARRHAGLQAVDALLAAALQLDGGRYATPYGFVRALRRAGAQVRLPAPADAVRLLTVHGAKGLEAPVVFVADADPRPRPPERATLLIDWPAEQPAPAGVAFVAREAAPPPSLEGLLAAEQAARSREELNGLYVAMTRARHTLVFSRTPSKAAAPLSWWARVAPLAQPWAGPPGGALHSADGPILLPVLPPAPDRPAMPPAPAAADTAPLGRAVHRMLEWLARPGQPLPRAQWPAAATAAARAFGLAAGDEVLAITTRIADSPDCARFFDPTRLAWAGNEVALAESGELLRLDRLVAVDEGGARTWWVLDYKLAGDPAGDPSLRAQLARYRAAVQALQPGAPVHAAFITANGRLVPLPA